MRRLARTKYNERYFTHVATILRRDVTKEKDASRATDYKPLANKLQCRPMTTNAGAEIEDGDKIVSVMGFQLRFPDGSDVRDTDRVEVEGVVYSVVSLDPGRADALYLTATCTRSG